MTSKVEEYRAKASECAALAAATKDPSARRVLEQTAQQWYDLADGTERYEARKTPLVSIPGDRR
jgi:hypothetical protein